jgi:hypothetical protein
VEAALGRALATAEDAAAPTLLEEATDQLIGYLGCTPDPVPVAVKRVCARMVARVFAQAASSNAPTVGASQVQETAGPFSRGASFASGTNTGAPWLAAADKTVLRPHRCGGGFRSVLVESVQSGAYRRYEGQP